MANLHPFKLLFLSFIIVKTVNPIDCFNDSKSTVNLETTNGSLIFFLMLFNCKSELRDWIKRPKNLRAPMQVS